MDLNTLIKNYNFQCPESRSKLETALASRKPLVAFDCTRDSLFHQLFDRYAGNGYEFVGLTPGDFDALAEADGISVAGRAFFVR